MGHLYKITLPNGKSYIGITINKISRRMALHKNHAKSGRPGALQNAIRKYGFDSISVDVLINSDNWDYLCILEKISIMIHRTKFPSGYNLTDGGEGNYGYKASDETRKKLSESNKGKNVGPRPELRGKTASDETRAKIIASLTGRFVSEETRQKHRDRMMGNKFNFGRVPSEETKKKISDAQKGRPLSESHREALKGVQKGKPWSEARRLAHESRKNVINLAS